MDGEGDSSPFRYHLELTPKQLKITHTALRSLLDDFGHDEAEVHILIQEVLAKLPDEHAIRAIALERESSTTEPTLVEVPPEQGEQPELPRPEEDSPGPGDEPPPTVA